MASTSANSGLLSPVQYREKRREPRVALELPIEVSGFNHTGRFFTEITLTSNVSDNGCGFGLHTEVDNDAVVAIRPIQQQEGAPCEVRRVLFRVAHVRQTEDAWTLGAAKLDQDKVWSFDSLR